MTKEDFRNTRWSGGMKVTYNNRNYDIISVDFEDFTICFELGGATVDMSCDNCECVFYKRVEE